MKWETVPVHGLKDAPRNFVRLAKLGLVRFAVHSDDMGDLSYLDQDVFSDMRDAELRRANEEGMWGIGGQHVDPTTGAWERDDECWGFIGED